MDVMEMRCGGGSRNDLWLCQIAWALVLAVLTVVLCYHSGNFRLYFSVYLLLSELLSDFVKKYVAFYDENLKKYDYFRHASPSAQNWITAELIFYYIFILCGFTKICWNFSVSFKIWHRTPHMKTYARFCARLYRNPQNVYRSRKCLEQKL
jgi:hypothetical protein